MTMRSEQHLQEVRNSEFGVRNGLHSAFRIVQGIGGRMKLFSRHQPSAARRSKRDIPAGLWTKCEACDQLIYNKALEENLRVCSKCDFHFPLTALQRIALTLDEGTFAEWDADLMPADPLQFRVPRPYAEKMTEEQQI